MNFDWQTEQDREDVWQQEEEAEGAESRSSSRRRWLALVAVAALLLLAGFLVRREAQLRVEEATATVKEEVVSSHRLGLQAAQAGDDELFVTLLSGREPSWTETQKALLGAGLLFDRATAPFGLQPAGDPDVVEVSFSPDLQAAELRMSQRYRPDVATGTHTVTLQQTLVYREGQQRWLLSPPEAEFWGSWDSVTQGALTVDFPVRDEEIARRLAGDLADMLDEMCETLTDLGCTPGWWMRLRLEKNPESLLALGEAEAAVPTGTEISLPAPSLVGAPADDTAYRALLRGYARYLVAAAIGDLVEWECCETGTLFYQALLREQLAQLGLLPQPAPQTDYLYLVDEGVSDGAIFTAVRRHWNESTPVAPGEEVPLAVHAFLDFLREEEVARPAVEMLRSVGHVLVLDEWVEPADQDVNLRDRLEARFQRFVRDRVERVSEEIEPPAGLTLPQKDLLLACGDGELGLHRYGLATGTWSLEGEVDAEYVQMTSGSADGTVAILAFSEGDEEMVIRNFLWRPGDELIQVAGTGVPDSDRVWLPLAFSPTGELVAMFYTLPVEESPPSIGLVDLESCAAGECSEESLPGLPVWSPSGERALALDVFFDEGMSIYLREGGNGSWEVVARGLSPFWLDNETYAYLPQTEQVTLGSVWAAPVGGEPQRLVPVEDLSEVLADELSGRRPSITWAFPQPRNENQLLVAARLQGSGERLLFSVERPADGTPWLEAPLTIRFVERFAETTNMNWFDGWIGLQDVISPNGRWLLLTGSPETANGELWLYDLQEKETILRSRAQTVSGPFFAGLYDWTADGEWLVRVADGMIDVLAPAFQVDGRPYRQLIFHDFEACTQALWVDGE